MFCTTSSIITTTAIDVNTTDSKLNNQNTQANTKMLSATPKNKQIVPPEIIMHLIKVMVEAADEKWNRPTIICIGLTAHIYWDYLLTKYPMQKPTPTTTRFPTSLEQPFLDRDAMRRLAAALKDWIGPDYRRVSELFLNETLGCQTFWVRRDVYGDRWDNDCPQLEEKKLAQRFYDYKNFPSKSWHQSLTFHSPYLQTLPNPYGLGMQWYLIAGEVMQNIMSRWACELLRWKSPTNMMDASEYQLLYAYQRSFLHEWIQETNYEDTIEIRTLKRDLRLGEARIWAFLRGEDLIEIVTYGGAKEDTDVVLADDGSKIFVGVAAMLVFAMTLFALLLALRIPTGSFAY